MHAKVITRTAQQSSPTALNPEATNVILFLFCGTNPNPFVKTIIQRWQALITMLTRFLTNPKIPLLA
jgi:hypothetical protein